ncbi:MAG TPA: ribosome biogenesis GTP-binding protein YihA/YsxC [Prolixibacteraceae bacterium]|nr:ribosome biogenesis GTP-binding protein YihA/YsxC [Prolixibacteraceae bacterium]
MEIKQVKFLVSNTKVEKCPKPDKPEYAFIGRSNVGKSSLINMLVKSRSLAKISSKPGKTQLINHFLVNESWYLVDLPGYGYAQVPKTEREKWEKFVRQYILRRTNLYCLFVLVDSRHDPQPADLEFMEWLGISRIPFAIIFTKTDKLKPSELDENLARYREVLLQKWEELPPVFDTSSVSGDGREEILNFIEQVNLSN